MSIHTFPAKPQRIPAPDPARVIHLMAMCALIQKCFREAQLVGGAEARQLLSILVRAGIATVTELGGKTTIDMHGVRAETTSTAHALLSNWMSAAHRRIEGVV